MVVDIFLGIPAVIVLSGSAGVIASFFSRATRSSICAGVAISADVWGVEEHFWLTLHVARNAVGTVRPGGSLLFMSGTGGRRPASGLAIAASFSAALPALTKVLALELAPVRVNLIAPGFVDTPLSASLLGDKLDARRDELRATLPIGRVVEATDVAALAVHLMTNTALTGAAYDVDGGQQVAAG